MKVVLAVLLLVATASAAQWGVLPYGAFNTAGVYSGLPYSGLTTYTGPQYTGLPLHTGVTYTAGSAIPIDGGYPYTDALGFSTGLTNAGARIASTYNIAG